VKSQESNQGEASKHFVQGVTTKYSSNTVRVALAVLHLQLLIDDGLVHQGVQHVQHGVNIPNLWFPLQKLNFLLGFLKRAWTYTILVNFRFLDYINDQPEL
jgi:hypothetical protein